MQRKFKQLIYLLFFALCWTALIAGIYFLFLKPAPSCYDGKQNQGEEGVDCGGPCATVCIPSSIKSISVVDRVVWLKTADNRYVIFAAVKNENATFAARSFGYTFKAYDAGGNLIQTASGDSYIYAGDVRYLFLPNVSIVGDPARVTLDINNPD